MNQYYEDADGNVYAKLDGWTIETYETVGTCLAQKITSPAGAPQRPDGSATTGGYRNCAPTPISSSPA